MDLRFQACSQAFIPLWLGQLISNLGTQVSLYALGLCLYQRQEQLATFASVAIAVQLAKLLVVPLLSRRLQCWPRRRVLLLAHSLATVTTVLLALALRQGSLPMAMVMGAIALAAAAEMRLKGFSTLLVDTSPQAQDAAKHLAQVMGAQYLALPYAGANSLNQAVRAVADRA